MMGYMDRIQERIISHMLRGIQVAYGLAKCDAGNCIATSLNRVNKQLFPCNLLSIFFILFVISFSGMVFMTNAYENMEMLMFGSISPTYLIIYPSQP